MVNNKSVVTVSNFWFSVSRLALVQSNENNIIPADMTHPPKPQSRS